MIYPINLIPHWGDTRELNPELKSHYLPCCRYTSAAIERDGERGGNRTRHCHGFADRALVQYWELALFKLVPVLRVSTQLPPLVCDSLVIGQTYGF